MLSFRFTTRTYLEKHQFSYRSSMANYQLLILKLLADTAYHCVISCISGLMRKGMYSTFLQHSHLLKATTAQAR